MVRAEILDQIQSRIISKSSSVEYFLGLLELIVKETPEFLYNYIARVCIKNYFPKCSNFTKRKLIENL